MLSCLPQDQALSLNRKSKETISFAMMIMLEKLVRDHRLMRMKKCKRRVRHLTFHSKNQMKKRMLAAVGHPRKMRRYTNSFRKTLKY
jgi:hypothetical protein